MPGWGRRAWCSMTSARCTSRPMPVTGFVSRNFPKSGAWNPKITIGLLTDAAGFPLAVEAFEGNKAKTATMAGDQRVQGHPPAHRCHRGGGCRDDLRSQPDRPASLGPVVHPGGQDPVRARNPSPSPPWPKPRTSPAPRPTETPHSAPWSNSTGKPAHRPPPSTASTKTSLPYASRSKNSPSGYATTTNKSDALTG